MMNLTITELNLNLLLHLSMPMLLATEKEEICEYSVSNFVSKK